MIGTTEPPGRSAGSLGRTYRNLRIAIGSVVVIVVVSVSVAALEVGILSSISAYYYTSARSMFVGALIAASLALLVISGRGLQRVVLDLAGLLAALIAIVPTPIADTTVPNLSAGCGPEQMCVPVAFHADVENGIITYLIVGALVVLVVLGLALSPSKAMGIRQVAPSLVAAVTVLGGVFLFWSWAPGLLLETGHFMAASGFFLLIGVAAIANLVPQAGELTPSSAFRVLYWMIAAGFVIDFAIVIIVVLNGNVEAFTIPPILVCELVALGLFLLFWILQSFPKWKDNNPSMV